MASLQRTKKRLPPRDELALFAWKNPFLLFADNPTVFGYLERVQQMHRVKDADRNDLTIPDSNQKLISWLAQLNTAPPIKQRLGGWVYPSADGETRVTRNGVSFKGTMTPQRALAMAAEMTLNPKARYVEIRLNGTD